MKYVKIVLKSVIKKNITKKFVIVNKIVKKPVKN